MRSFVAFLAALSLCQARPQTFSGGSPSFFMDGEQYVVGGQDAAPGEFPWQLSQTRGGGHSCGASLLNANNALSAAHCVDGAPVNSIQIIAGLHRRSDLTGTQTVDITSYAVHENYLTGAETYSNDIAVIHLATSITYASNIQPATLPANNNNNYAGLTCVVSGWGRTSASNDLPDTLQKASIGVITTGECQNLVNDVPGTLIWDNHICVYDAANNAGSCNGDSGGPLNCPDGVTRVTGITSWIMQSGGTCLQNYPSVYTRTSTYLDWINSNSL